MPLFIFIFTRPEHALESARVAARTKEQAWLLLQCAFGFERRPAGVIVSASGRADVADPAILSAIRRSDRAQLIVDGTLALATGGWRTA